MGLVLLCVYVIGLILSYFSLTVSYEDKNNTNVALYLKLMFCIFWFIMFPIMLIFGEKE